jgi:hypothetical protein
MREGPGVVDVIGGGGRTPAPDGERYACKFHETELAK